MNWQIFVFLNIVLSVVFNLLTRSLGKTAPQYNRSVNVIFSVCFHLPMGLLVAQFIGYDLAIGWQNALYLMGFSIIFPLGGLIGYRVSKDVDAGLHSIISTLNPIMAIILAVLIRGEVFTTAQAIGVLIIFAAALMVTIPSYNRSARSTKLGIVLALFSVGLVGMGTVYEVWMLDRIGLGTYYIYGFGMQTIWMLILTSPERHKIKKLWRSKYRNKAFLQAGTRSLKGFSFVAALSLSNSASTVSAFNSFIPVLIVISAYFILKEKQNFGLKFAGAALGSVGLLVLSLA